MTKKAAAPKTKPIVLPTVVPGATISQPAALARTAAPGTVVPPLVRPAAAPAAGGFHPPLSLAPPAAEPNTNHSSVWHGVPQGPPAPPAPEPTLVDRLKELLPELKLDTYTKPYNDAEAAARGAAEQAIPDIQLAYGQMRDQLGTGRDDLLAQLGKERASLVQGNTALGNELAQRAADTAASLRAGGVENDALLQGYGAEMQARQAAARQTGDARLAQSDRLAEIARQDATDRIADSRLAEGAATSNVRSNLASLLSKIGMGRASAEQQYDKDAAGREVTLFNAANKQAESDAKVAAEKVKMLKNAAVTPRQLFERGYADQIAKYPQASKVFEDIVSKVKGTGPMAAAQAMRLLDQAAPVLQAGQFEIQQGSGAKAVRTPIKARINPEILRSWLASYYDNESKTIDPSMVSSLLG